MSYLSRINRSLNKPVRLKWKPARSAAAWLTKKRRRKIKQYFWLVFWAAFMSFLSVYTYGQDKEQRSLDAHGVPATATVADKSVVKTTKGTTISYDMWVAFIDNAHRPGRALIEVSKTDYDEFNSGDSIDILYNPSDLTQAKALYYNINYWWWAPIFIVFSALLGGLQIATWIRRRGKSKL